MKLTLFIAAHMVLCYGFVTETVLITHQFFKLLLNSACTSSRISLFLTLPTPMSRLDWQWTSLEGDTARAETTRGIFHLT